MVIVDMLDTGNALDISQELLISADSHVTEPGDLWKTGLPASMRDDAPVFAIDAVMAPRTPLPPWEAGAPAAGTDLSRAGDG